MKKVKVRKSIFMIRELENNGEDLLGRDYIYSASAINNSEKDTLNAPFKPIRVYNYVISSCQ